MNNSTEKQNKKLGRGLGSLLGGSGAFANETSQTTSQDIQNTNAKNEELASQNKVSAHYEGASKEANSQINKQVEVKTIVVEQKIDEDKRVWFISVDKMVPGQYQPRKKFDKESLSELAKSIKENGILQPVVVRKRQAGGYEIVAGERRWRAAQQAGLHEVPALIKNYTDQDALQLALIENIQREDLDPIEEAESYQRLIEEFNLSQQEAADKVGKERSTVANALRLLVLPYEIKALISEDKISVGHAKVLLSVDNKQDQLKYAKITIDKSLSVRALESMLKTEERKTDETASFDSKEKLASQMASQLASQIQKKLGTKTEISYKKGKGSIVIKFYSDEQLNDLYEKLNK